MLNLKFKTKYQGLHFVSPPLFIYFDSPPFHLKCIYILVYHTLIHPYLYFILFYGQINVLT